METGESLSAPERVQRLQQALHAKAKEAPGFRFYSLCDKVWRADVLEVAWQAVRRNGGAAGVDGETVADIEAYGVERWLGELARDLKEGTYRPKAVRQVLIPKKQRGKFRALGIPCIRDRVAQTAAMVVLSPIFEADLEPEQYAYRPGRGAHDAVKHVHRLLNTGHREVVDADLSDYFGQIPHAELLRPVARRVSDGRMLGWVKAWLEMAVEEDDGKGGRRRTNRARRERKGTGCGQDGERSRGKRSVRRGRTNQLPNEEPWSSRKRGGSDLTKTIRARGREGLHREAGHTTVPDPHAALRSKLCLPTRGASTYVRSSRPCEEIARPRRLLGREAWVGVHYR